VVIGFAAGLLSFIPYLGSLSGLVISTCVAIAQFWPDWTSILLVPAIFFVGQFLADYVLAPYLVGRRVHLSPVWVMFALFAFGYLFGFVGLLIAVPLAAAVGVLMRFALRQYYASPLYAAAAAPTAPCARWMHQHLLPTRATSRLAHHNKRRAWVSLFDHFVGAGEQRRRHVESELGASTGRSAASRP